MASERIRQINELLRTELAIEFSRELELPDNCVVSITKIDTSPDLKNATICVSIIPDQKAGTILKILQKQLPHIKASIKSRITFRNLPKFRLKYDPTEKNASHIEQLLDSIKENE